MTKRPDKLAENTNLEETKFQSSLANFIRTHELTTEIDIEAFITFFTKKIDTFIFFGPQSNNSSLTTTAEYNKNKRVKVTALTKLSLSNSHNFDLKNILNSENLELTIEIDDYIVLIILSPANYWQGNPDTNEPKRIYAPYKVIFNTKVTTERANKTKSAINDLLDLT